MPLHSYCFSNMDIMSAVTKSTNVHSIMTAAVNLYVFLSIMVALTEPVISSYVLDSAVKLQPLVVTRPIPNSLRVSSLS